MPIWLEVVSLMLACYALGIVAGWLIWGRIDTSAEREIASETDGEDI